MESGDIEEKFHHLQPQWLSHTLQRLRKNLVADEWFQFFEIMKP